MLFQCPGMVGKAVADVVQAQRMGQMGIDHGNDMACGAERTGLDPVLFCEILYDSVRYPTCNLGENGHCMPCRCHGLSYGCLVAAIKMSLTPIISTAPSSYRTAVQKDVFSNHCIARPHRGHNDLKRTRIKLASPKMIYGKTATT